MRPLFSDTIPEKTDSRRQTTSFRTKRNCQISGDRAGACAVNRDRKPFISIPDIQFLHLIFHRDFRKALFLFFPEKIEVLRFWNGLTDFSDRGTSSAFKSDILKIFLSPAHELPPDGASSRIRQHRAQTDKSRTIQRSPDRDRSLGKFCSSPYDFSVISAPGPMDEIVHFRHFLILKFRPYRKYHGVSRRILNRIAIRCPDQKSLLGIKSSKTADFKIFKFSCNKKLRGSEVVSRFGKGPV